MSVESSEVTRVPVSEAADPIGPVAMALLLDLDDTLIDTRAAMVAAGEAAAAHLWPELDAAVHHAAGVHFHGDPSGSFGRFTTGEMSFAQMRRARIADLVASFSLPSVDDVNGQFEQAYAPAFGANLRVFDDVWPFLEAAGEAGITMGLLTNSSARHTRQKLEITGLAGVFDVVVTTDTLGYGKPDPRAFHHACRLLGSDPAETRYLGDHLEIDAIAAQAAGLRGVWLQRDPCDVQGVAGARAHGIPVVTSLSQVPALLLHP